MKRLGENLDPPNAGTTTDGRQCPEPQPLSNSDRNSDCLISQSTQSTSQADASDTTDAYKNPTSTTCSSHSNGDLQELKTDTKLSTTKMNSPDSELSQDSVLKPEPQARPWETTMLRLGPLTGVACMMMAALSIWVSFAILMGSHGEPTIRWPFEPSTYIAICTAVANQSMRFAAWHGFIVAWWFRATRGSTIARLHADWQAGTTLIGAITAGRNMGMLGVGCILSTLVAIDGPLLQRATRVVPAPIVNQPVSLDIAMVPEIPTGFSGYWGPTGGALEDRYILQFNRTFPTPRGHAPNDIWASEGNSSIYSNIRPYYANDPMPACSRGCNGTCKAKIRAPALMPTACTSHAIPVNYTHPVNLTTVSGYWDLAPPLTSEAFFIDMGFIVNEQESINLITAFSQTTNCAGLLHYTVCNLVSAVGEYEVTIKGNGLVLPDAVSPTIVAVANNTRAKPIGGEATPPWHKSTLAGVVFAGLRKWHSAAKLLPGGNGTISSMTQGGTSLELYIAKKPFTMCPSWIDPTKDVLQDLNRLMLYIGVIAAQTYNASYLQSYMDPGLEIQTQVTGSVVGTQNIFHSNMRWFGAAASLEALCIVLILPTYVRWWRLGRPMTFSPLEIAKAFEAPMLSDVNSNSNGRDIVKAVGDVRVQYGETREEGTTAKVTKLAFASPASVSPPVDQRRFEV